MSPSESRAESKISQLDMTIVVNENVVRFDVSVNEVHAMNALHSAGQFGNIKPKKYKYEIFQNSKYCI